VASQARVFCEGPRERFVELLNDGQRLCNTLRHAVWGAVAPHGSGIETALSAPTPAGELQSQVP
jgi:hypothetical protein